MDDKTSALLQQLSDKLGTSVEHLYKVLVKQAKMDAFICFLQLGILLLSMIPLFIGWVNVLPHCVPVNPNGQYSFDREWPGEIQLAVIALSISSMVLTIGIGAGLMRAVECIFKNLLNPEASAIEKILVSFKQ